MTKEVASLITELHSYECRCGRLKKPHHPLCRGCYNELPRNLGLALHSRIGEGYERAYRSAVEFLEAKRAL